MSTKLANFIHGNTKKWTVTFPYDVTGAVVKFRMAKTLDQAAPDLEITGTVNDPPQQNTVDFVISAADSQALGTGRFYAEHEILLSGELYTFNSQENLLVNAGVPKA